MVYRGKKNATTLYFRSGDLEKTHKELENKNIQISKIEKAHWGRKLFFTDLEGNTHFVYEEKQN